VTHVLVTAEVVQQPQFTEASLRQDLRHQRDSTEGSWELPFLVKTLVTFLTAQVSPVWACRADATHLQLSDNPPALQATHPYAPCPSSLTNCHGCWSML
jgi:hypothetical protein